MKWGWKLIFGITNYRHLNSRDNRVSIVFIYEMKNNLKYIDFCFTDT